LKDNERYEIETALYVIEKLEKEKGLQH